MSGIFLRVTQAAAAALLCGAVATRIGGQAVTGSVAPLQSGGSAEAAAQAVAGRVTSAADGHGIANATVTLSMRRENVRRQTRVPGAPQGTSVQTDAEGHYRLPPQAAGRYTLQASAPGYLSSLYMEHQGFNAAVVTGAGLATDNLSLVLLPEASLHGRVLDDTGEPVQATINLYRDASDEGAASPPDAAGPQPMRPAGGTQADEDGRYEFQNLRPGRYYVAASAAPWYAVHPQPQADQEHMPYRTSIDPALDVAFPTTFYPHATTESGAVPIALKAGQRATANLLMQPERAVTLRVQLPSAAGGPEGGLRQFPALFQKVFGTDQSLGSRTSARINDSVVISGLPPGQYFMRPFGSREAPQTEATPVNLTGGSTTVDMPAGVPGASGEVKIALRDAGGAPLAPTVAVHLEHLGPQRGDELAPATVEGGVASFKGVPPGLYRIALQQDGHARIVSRLSVNGKAVRSRLLRVDGDVRADLISSDYAPEVDGVVHAADGKAHPGSLVVLVPAGGDNGSDLFRADESDLDGGFQFSGVLPGKYLVVAIDDDWGVNWRDASSLQRYLTHAVPVIVPASGPRTFKLPEVAVAQER